MHTWMHVYRCIHTRMFGHCLDQYDRAYHVLVAHFEDFVTEQDIHACMHACAETYRHACMHAYIQTCMHA